MKRLNNILIGILVALVLCCYIVGFMFAIGFIDYNIITVDDYAEGGKYCIHNKKGYMFFIENNGYNIGDTILVLYNIDDLFSFNLVSW